MARRVETIGVTGLVGSGHEDIPYLLFGARNGDSGRVAIGETHFLQAQLTLRRTIASGVALLPADRRNASAVGSTTVRENICQPVLRRFFKGAVLRERLEHQHAGELIRLFDVRPTDTEMLMSSLSGGNQQKALLAKWLQSRPSVLLLHEPTHGVDIGSRRTIFRLIKEVASAGASVIRFNTEYADLANLCRRVLALQHGRQVAELAHAGLSEDRIIAKCMMDDRLCAQFEPTAGLIHPLIFRPIRRSH